MSDSARQLADEVMRRCNVLAGFSEDPDGITRRFLTEPMHDVHRVLQEWMREAKMVPRVDHAGNCIGRLPAAHGERVLLIGSHLDTVPNSGRYDGVLGVLIGLAVVEQLADHPLPFHLDVLGLSEEEGVRFKMPYLGSAAIAGRFRNEWLDRVDEQDLALRDAIAAFHLDPQRINEAAYERAQVIGYLEPHLEQGPVLEHLSRPVGVVSGIAGQSRLRLAFEGEPGHAGTTPMLGRSDALVAAARFIHQVCELGNAVDGLRATVGYVQVLPNTPNVIPSRVELTLDVRHVDDRIRRDAIDQLLECALQFAKRQLVGFTLLEENSQDAAVVDPRLTELLQDTLVECGQKPFTLPSGAGHDAVVMSHAFPVAMLFVRHPGGESHCPEERVRVEDVAVAIDVLTRCVLRLAEMYPTDTKTTPA